MMMVEVSILVVTVKMREYSNSHENSQLRLGFESSQNSDLGLEPTVFLLKSRTCYKDLMKLRLFMFPCRRNSTRGDVIGKKWIYLEICSRDRMQSVPKGKSDPGRNTLYSQSVGHSQKVGDPKICSS